MASKELSIIIKARDLASGAIKGVRAQVKGLSHEAKAAGSAIGKNVSRGIAAAAVGAAAAIAYSVQQASDLNETLNKVDVVFGKGAKTVHDFGLTAAGSFGESRQEAEAAAATFGNLFRAADIVGQKGADMSVQMTKLAGDLASFHNVDPTQVLEDLQSGLVGEARPLRQYGILLSEAAVQQEGVRLGLVKGKTALTDQQKVLARYALIMKDAGVARGDFARTSQGLANQERIVKAELKDTAAVLGTALLPSLTKGTIAFTTFLKAHQGDIKAFADKLASALPGFIDRAAKFLSGLPWGSIASAFKALGWGAKVAMDAFLAAPPWLQTAILTGWGLNKLSDGHLGGLFGQLASGLIKGVLGMNAGVVNAKAAVVNVSGGIPGGGGGLPVGGAPGGWWNKIPPSLVGALDVAAIAGVVAAYFHEQNDVIGPPAKKEADTVASRMATNNMSDLLKLQADLRNQLKAGGGDPIADILKQVAVNPVLDAQLKALDAKIADLKAHPQAPPKPINPATVSDYAVRHRAQVEKPVAKLDAKDFLALIRKTAFIGPDAYKSIWERIGGKGRDPFGQQLLSLYKNVAPAQLKVPGVLADLKGHIQELQSLEKFYLSKGQTSAASATDATLRALARLANINLGQTPYLASQTRATILAKDAVDRQNPELASIRTSSAITAAKKTAVTIHASIPVTVVNNMSINEWQRKVVSQARANANYGGFI